MRICVVGAGIGGLAAAARLAALGHDVLVLERAESVGGKCGRRDLGGYRFDTGPSLLTLPGVLRDLFAATGAALEDELELVRVEPITRYRFADGSQVELSADLPRALAALEAWSPGAGGDWAAFLGACAAMWRAATPFLTAPAPWPPRRPRAGERPPDPRDLVRVRPWRTLRGLARAQIADPRLRLVVERFATYAGADPRRAPAALALAGYVEHAFGAWHVRGGLGRIAGALAGRVAARGGTVRTGVAAQRIVVREDRVVGVETDAEAVPCDAVVVNADAAELARDLLPAAARGRLGERTLAAERSLSGFALLLGLRGRTPGLAHHTIHFPADYDAEFDDIFARRRPVADPTVYVSASCVSDPDEAPPDGENWFVLVNAPVHAPGVPDGLDWDREADGYEARVLEVLAARGVDVRDRIVVRARRTPADLERETGAVGGAIYGAAPHGRLGALRRPGNAWPGVGGLHLVGGSVHPGGGLPLVMLGAAIVAREIGAAP